MRIGIRLGGALFGLGVALWGTSASAQSAEQVAAVPLGGALQAMEGERYYGVYVPTRFGGELTIKTSDGKVEELKGPDGAARVNGHEIGQDRQGWYTFKVAGAKKSYKVETKFVQTAQSLKKPWNFYYWPTKADALHEPWAGGNGRADTVDLKGDDVRLIAPGGYIEPGKDIISAGPNGLLETLPSQGDELTWFPNLYDDLFGHNGDGTIFESPAPLLKYDQIFGTSARLWEAANTQNHDVSRWPGHCLGGAVASIAFEDPIPAPGTGLSKDELKALYAELGENHLNHRIGDYATDIPAGPPRPGPDPTDWKVPRVHAMLETHIRGERRALLANMRAFPPRGSEFEVWNQAVYKYVAEYKAIPSRGPRAVLITIDLHCNSGSALNGQDEKDRVATYEYSLVYGLDGRVDETNPAAADWIAVRGEALYAPLNVLEVLSSAWSGHNPYVTLDNVRSLDLANGGAGNARFAGRPPEFLPVARFEAGRTAPNQGGSLYANGAGGQPAFANGADPNSAANSPRRSSFFGFFRGR
jgi:hypothetical protein